ncbi:MAG: hypothetical protein V3U75_10000, partial [Methylococcaceae bacterium]
SLVLSKMGQTSQVLDYSSVLQSPYLMTQGSIDREYFKVLSPEQPYKEIDLGGFNIDPTYELLDISSTPSFFLERAFQFVKEPSFVHPYDPPKPTLIAPAPPAESVVDEEEDLGLCSIDDPLSACFRVQEPPAPPVEPPAPPVEPPAPPVEPPAPPVEPLAPPVEPLAPPVEPPAPPVEPLAPNTVYGNEDQPIALNLTEIEAIQARKDSIIEQVTADFDDTGIEAIEAVEGVSGFLGDVYLKSNGQPFQYRTSNGPDGLHDLTSDNFQWHNNRTDSPQIDRPYVAAVEAVSFETRVAEELDIAITEALDSFTITISNVPDGAILSDGVDNSDGSWLVTMDQLTDLTVMPPSDSDVEFFLVIGKVVNQGVLDAAELIVSQEFINARTIDQELSDALVKLTKPGMPESAIRMLLQHAETWVSEGLTLPDDLAKLIANAVTEYIPPNAYLNLTNFKAAVMLIFDVVNESWTASKEAIATIDAVQAIIDEYDYAVVMANAIGVNQSEIDAAHEYKDQVIFTEMGSELNINMNIDTLKAITPGDPYLLVSMVMVTAENVQKAITIYDARVLLQDIADGTKALKSDIDAAQAIVDDSLIDRETINVVVAADADAPTLVVNDASGIEDQPIALDISAALTDTDDSESLSIKISVLVDEVLITEKVTADMADEITAYKNMTVSNLKIYYNSNSKYEWVSNDPYFELIGDIDRGWGKNLSDVDGVNVYALMVETRDSIDVVVNEKSETAIAEALQSAENIAGNSSLSAGTENAAGSWTLTAEQLTGLTVTPPTNSDVDFQLSVTATTTEADGGDTATTTGTIDVSVAAVADVPTLVVNDVSTSINQPIPLEIFASLVDLDGSESLSIIISNKDGPSLMAVNSPQASADFGFGFGGGIELTSDPIPIFAFEGADNSVPVGFDNGDGSWILTEDQLNDLILNLEQGFDDNFQLFVTATSTEIANGDEASISAIINVSFFDGI